MIIPPIRCEYFPNLFDMAFISNVFIAIKNMIMSSIKKKITYIIEYIICDILLSSLIVRICVNITGSPKEHSNSIMFTETAKMIIPSTASAKDFSFTIFFIDVIIFFLLF